MRGLLLALRVIAGTVLFAFVLLTIRAPDGRLAGMMLTFPALNGISLLMTPVSDKVAMARAMLPVIALNGWLSLGFISAFDALVRWTGGAVPAAVWGLAGLALVVWLGIIAALSRPHRLLEKIILLGFVAVAPFLIVAWWHHCPPATLVAPMSLNGVLASNAGRIALFAATLTLLLGLAEWRAGAERLLGRLGAFPLLPLFSLVTLALSEPTAAASLERLESIRPAIIAGLFIAMGFAHVYARFLTCGRERTSMGWARDTAGLMFGWAVTAALIAAIAALSGAAFPCARS